MRGCTSHGPLLIAVAELGARRRRPSAGIPARGARTRKGLSVSNKSINIGGCWSASRCRAIASGQQALSAHLSVARQSANSTSMNPRHAVGLTHCPNCGARIVPTPRELKQWRRAADLTQRQIAARLKISAAHVVKCLETQIVTVICSNVLSKSAISVSGHLAFSLLLVHF